MYIDPNKCVSIFGAGRMDKNCKEYKETIKIGKILARKEYLLFNGGYGGIMEASAKVYSMREEEP